MKPTDANYMAARDLFLDGCGELTKEERIEAIKSFDRTMSAAAARFADAAFDFGQAMREATKQFGPLKDWKNGR